MRHKSCIDAICLFGIGLASVINYCCAQSADHAQDVQMFYGPDGYANALREFEYVTVKDFLNATGRDMVWTSGHRDATGGSNPSAAHADGAVDFRTNDISSQERHSEAQAVSAILGPSFTVVVEEAASDAMPDGSMAPVIVETPYCNGVVGHVKSHVPQSSDNVTHTHVQRTAGLKSADVAKSLGLKPTSGSFQRLAEITGGQFFGTVHTSPGNAWNFDLNKIGFNFDFNLGFKPLTKADFAAAILKAIAAGGGPSTGLHGPPAGGAATSLGLSGWRPSQNPNALAQPVPFDQPSENGIPAIELNYGGPTMAPGGIP